MIDFKNEVLAIKDLMIKDIVKLCAVESTHDESTIAEGQPFGKACKDALELMLSFAKRDGFEHLNVDGYAGHIDIGNSNKMIGILGHVDVVPANIEGFDNYPFDVVIKNNKLIGRGVADDKGPLLAAYYAAKIVHSHVSEPIRKTRVIFGCNEELGSSCVKYYFTKQPYPECGFTPDAGFPVVYGEKAGCFSKITGELECQKLLSLKAGTRINVVPDNCQAIISGNPSLYSESFNNFLLENKISGELKEYNDNTLISVNGKSAHGSTPELGLNSIVLMSLYLNTIINNPLIELIATSLKDTNGQSLGCYHKGEMGELTMSLGVINYSNGKFELEIDMRAPHDIDFDLLKSSLYETANKYNFTAHMNIGDYLFINQDSDLIKILHGAYSTVTNNTDKPQAVGGGTYAKQMPNCVAFGPQFPHEDNHIHEDNESIDIDSLLLATEIYARAIYDLVTKKEV